MRKPISLTVQVQHKKMKAGVRDNKHETVLGHSEAFNEW